MHPKKKKKRSAKIELPKPTAFFQTLHRNSLLWSVLVSPNADIFKNPTPPSHLSFFLSLPHSLCPLCREMRREEKRRGGFDHQGPSKVKVNSCLMESISMVPSPTSARHNKSLLGVSPPHPHHYHHHQQQQQQQRHLLEAISLLLSRWNGLQMAIQNQWGGHDSLQKSRQLETDIFSWFSQSKGHILLLHLLTSWFIHVLSALFLKSYICLFWFAALLYVEDLENLLHECMLFSFNTEIEDGSIEEVLYTPFEFWTMVEEHVWYVWINLGLESKYLDHIAIAVKPFKL